MKTERTSARVAKIAASILAVDLPVDMTAMAKGKLVRIRWADIQSVAASCLTQAPNKAEVARLRKRLEITHYWQFIDGKMRRRKLKPGEYLPDGIDCRDETIRQQDRYIKELLGRLAALQPKAKRTQVFKASGNYVPPPVTRNLEVKLIGAGPARIKSKRPSIDRQRVLRRGP